MRNRPFAALALFAACLLLIPAPLLAAHAPYARVPARPDPSDELLKQSVMAYTWYQTSAEARALYYQAFALADMMLEKDLADRSVTKKRAVIVDIDETLLDNSPYNVAQLENHSGTEALSWNEWVKLAQARALPGAVDFLTKAHKRGVDIYYVSNRSVEHTDSTIRNLIAAGFPQARATHLLLSDGESSKESRRQQIERDHHIVLLMGDNLSDFAQIFDGRSVADRSKAVDLLKEKFGRSFIVLPNPMYGDWEYALYNYRQLSPEQKLEARKKALSPSPSPVRQQAR
ncbi:5'-nucleotidase, lipoprotein e(P4) family [Brevibacillus fluminis]|uniref:5'-nucleotidase, lipoprotein e(P4) family n=1 Tax=Brevibacillus fluminis TaxID=511487 RepID=UPI003F8914E0